MPFLAVGFRPFFLGAALFAIAGMASWLAVYRYGAGVPLAGLPPSLWHGHEMVFGYGMAVIAGFLLTAARNWTDRETARGAALALLFGCWLLARGALLFGPPLLPLAAAADLVFMLGLFVALARPIVAVRQKRQAPVLLLLTLLTAANAAFYAGALGWLPGGQRLGVYTGLYLVLGLVLFMGNRVIPFFTERGVGYEVTLRRARWNDVATLVLFPLFLLAEVLLPARWPGAVLAAALLVLNSLRVLGWYTLGIWKKPLLWGLFAAFTAINLGFLMRALAAVTALPPNLALHAFAAGGIGLATIAMMARVSLGHTGRDVHQPPGLVTPMLVVMVLAALLRIVQPLADPARYPHWVAIAGLLWILAFTLFSIVFLPMLLRPRADGKP